MPRYAWPLIVLAIIVGLLLMFGSRVIVTVPVGHVAVATLFGEVEPEPYTEGLHFPVNPLLRWHFFDARQKTLKDQANVPSQDQLQTKIDVSVQFRLIGGMAARILKGTGSFEDAVNVHLVPNLRSLLREQGKSVERAEDFFAEETQQMLQVGIQRGLQSYLQDKGIEVQAVLIRDITLPTFIIRAIESKKEREQEVEKQRAELERYRTEQQQLVAMARAQREAAEQEAIKRRLLADAQAYEIEKINKAISNNPAYVQLQSLEALKSISKDPSSKIYFLNGDSPQPLPLMNMGESLRGK
jgi:regulator of protease activity HflC (stomatin/prohibitin superfamily)